MWISRNRTSYGAVATLLAALLLSPASPSHSSGLIMQRPSATPPRDAAVRAYVDSLARVTLRQGPGAGLTIGVVRGADTIVWRGWGEANIELRVPATPATVYRIGSITKQFTAALILHEVEAGRLSLDDPLSKYVPKYDTHGYTVTIRELLHHTAGVPSYLPVSAVDLSPSKLLAATVRDSLDFPPGTGWKYGNTDYYLLGLVLERVTGEPYDRLVDDSLTSVHGLRHTHYCWWRSIIEGRAEGYEATDSAHRVLVHARRIGAANPFSAGGLCSTVGDLVRWTRLLSGGGVVSQASYRLMSTPDTLPDDLSTHYGFGLFVDQVDGHSVVRHGGLTPGFVSSVAHYPEDHLIVVVLENAWSFPPALDAGGLGQRIARYALGISEPSWRTLHLPRPLGERMTGLYRLEDGSRLAVALHGDALIARASNGPTRKLIYGGETVGGHANFRSLSQPGVRYVFDLRPRAADSVERVAVRYWWGPQMGGLRVGDLVSPATSRAPRHQSVHVAPPTGDRTTDHANIVAAFERARPGDTIQFARGTYVVGRRIEDSTPGLTLLGAAAGTVLQGCIPDVYGKLRREERELHKAVTWSHGTRRVPPDVRARESVLVKRCGMFHLTAGHDTVRNLTFEYTRIGLGLGYNYQQGYRLAEGGYLIEGNTFRNSMNGIRAGLWSTEPTVIRRNTFVDTYHAVMAAGSHIRLLKNMILAPAPKEVPADQFPSLALAISTMVRGSNGATPEPTPGRCGDNVIAGNVVDGYPSGIELETYPDSLCRGNVVRDNTIAVRRVAFLRTSIGWGTVPLSDTTDPTWVGVPIRVGEPVIRGRSGRVEGTRIEDNRILGAEGYGISLLHASHVRIADNTIAGILVRNPFPGNANSGPKSPNANGAGIWISAGSKNDEIVDNTFADIASYPVVLEGDSNTVQTLSARDSVRDLGTGNRVTRREP